jgi:hypothetical protein
VFRKYGYDVYDNNAQHDQSLVLPQSLYNEKSFAVLAEALNTLAKANQQAAKARADDNHHADVDDLWGDWVRRRIGLLTQASEILPDSVGGGP